VIRDVLRPIAGYTLRDLRDRAVIGFRILSAMRRSELVAAKKKKNRAAAGAQRDRSPSRGRGACE
jgi:hypothetical protein